MAARFDGADDVLSRSASGLGSSSVTLACWVYIDVDRNDYTSFMGADDGSSNWFLLTLDGTADVGVTLSASTSGGGHIDGLTLSTGGWYFAAMVSDASGTDWLYWAAAGAGSLSSASGSFTTGINNAWTFRVGNNGFGEWLNGRVAFARVWTAALSSSDLLAERASVSAVRTSDLWADWSLASNGNDASGNGRHLTASGTVTYVAQPFEPSITLTMPTATLSMSGVAPTVTSEGVLAFPAGEVTLTGVPPSVSVSGGVTLNLPAAMLSLTGVHPSIAGATRFPVAVASSGRYLVDQHGDPWLAVGDTAWSIIGSLDDDEIAEYVDGIAALGINLTLISCPEPYYAPNATPSAPNNVDGVGPFTGTLFASSLRDAYWTRFDLLLDLCETAGITVLCCPFYLGASNSDGFGAQVDAAGNTNMGNYAAALHTRYGDRPNLMWLIGHDRLPGSTLTERADAFLTALTNAGNTQLWMFGGWHPRDVGGSDTLGFGSEDWAASSHTAPVDNQYDYSEHIAANAYIGWALGVRPFIFLEGKYELEQSVGEGAVLLREQMWAAWAAGACGVIFGNNPRWNFGNKWIFDPGSETWESSLSSDGTAHLAAFGEITGTLGDWWADTDADTGSTFVANQGSGTNRIAARFGADGGLIYHPNFTTGSISLDLSEFAGRWATVKVTRYDPVSGATTVIDASEATTNTAFSISAPSANSVGDRDWLFVVTGVDPQPITLTFPTATLSLTGVAPVVASDAVTLTLPTGTVALAGQAPAVAVGAVTLTAPTGLLTVAGVAPSIDAPDPIALTLPTGTVTLAGIAPTVAITGTVTLAAPTGALAIAGVAPALPSAIVAIVSFGPPRMLPGALGAPRLLSSAPGTSEVTP